MSPPFKCASVLGNEALLLGVFFLTGKAVIASAGHRELNYRLLQPSRVERDDVEVSPEPQQVERIYFWLGVFLSVATV